MINFAHIKTLNKKKAMDISKLLCFVDKSKPLYSPICGNVDIIKIDEEKNYS